MAAFLVFAIDWDPSWVVLGPPVAAYAGVLVATTLAAVLLARGRRASARVRFRRRRRGADDALRWAGEDATASP